MNKTIRQIGKGKHRIDEPSAPHLSGKSFVSAGSRSSSNTHRGRGQVSDSQGFFKPVRRESRLTLGGFIYIGVTLFLAVGAINSQNNLLFWLFGVTIATLVVSGIFSGNALMQVRLKAQSIPDSVAGETVRLHYTVRNNSKLFPLFAAVITEFEENKQSKNDHPNDIHPTGTHRSAALLHIGTRQVVRVHGSITPDHRGRYSVRMIRLSSRFPFGLLHKSLIFECHRQMLVMPYQLEIKPGLVRVVRGQGEQIRRRSNSTGASNEYWGMREYSPGDPMRTIAWKQSARHGSLLVVEHAVPVSSKLWVWIPKIPRKALSNTIHTERQDQSIDRQDQQGQQDQLNERAVALAASLIKQGTRLGIPVGVWMPIAGIQIQPGTGQRHIGRCIRALSLVNIAQGTGPDPMPPASVNDDVLKLSVWGMEGTHAISSPSQVRTLRVTTPQDWLKDPDSLPQALGGCEMPASPNRSHSQPQSIAGDQR